MGGAVFSVLSSQGEGAWALMLGYGQAGHLDEEEEEWKMFLQCFLLQAIHYKGKEENTLCGKEEENVDCLRKEGKRRRMVVVGVAALKRKKRI